MLRVALVCFVLIGAAFAHSVNLYAVLLGSNQVPVVNSIYQGACHMLYNSEDSSLDVDCWHNVPAATAAHIHAAAVGSNGEVVLPFASAASPIKERFNITADQAAALIAGGKYVNVHTAENPGGEIRGQIENTACPASGAAEDTWLFGRMDPKNEVPNPVTNSAASGLTLCQYNFAAKNLTCWVFHDIPAATAAHIHLGNSSTAGSVILPFAAAASPITQTFTVPDANLADMLAGNFYVNIHTAENPSGELRANLAVGCTGSAPAPNENLRAVLVALAALAGVSLSDMCAAAIAHP